MTSPSVSTSTLVSRIQISAQSRDIESTALELVYLPPMYVNVKEITFVTAQSQGAPAASFEVYGLPPVLEHLTVGRVY